MILALAPTLAASAPQASDIEAVRRRISDGSLLAITITVPRPRTAEVRKNGDIVLPNCGWHGCKTPQNYTCSFKIADGPAVRRALLSLDTRRRAAPSPDDGSMFSIEIIPTPRAGDYTYLYFRERRGGGMYADTDTARAIMPAAGAAYFRRMAAQCVREESR